MLCRQIILPLNCSFHPYLFFNQDNTSFTFMGFYIRNSSAIDPVSGVEIMPHVIGPELSKVLSLQGVNLNENYQKWLVLHSFCINLTM